MKEQLRESLINNAWGVADTETDTWKKNINATPCFITLYDNGFSYELAGMMDMYFPYSDITRIDEEHIIMQMGKVLIA